MKKNLIIASVIALAACFTSCSKTAQPGNGFPDAKAETGMLVVSVNPDNGSATKAEGSQSTVDSESAVTSLQVFIFYGATNDALGQTENFLETDAYEVFTGTASSRAKTITTTVGQKYIYAIANAPRLTGVTSIDDLRARILFLGNNYLTETTVGSETRRGLVMTGAYGYTSGDAQINVQSTRKEVTAYTQGNDATMTSVPIGLYRLAARIELDNIQVDFRNTDLEGKTFVVSEIYLKNVPNGVHFSGQNTDLLSGDDGYWTSKVTRESSPQDKSGLSVAPLVYEQRTGGGTTCSNTGSETAINSYFYAYPNPITNDASGDSWSQRRTRLVVHAKIDGVDTYYPISIADPRNFVSSDSSTPASSETHAQIVGNQKYVINKIVITSKGYPNDNHDEPLVTGKSHIEVSVQAWNGTTVLNYSI